MAELYFQVNVPTRHAVQPERCGLHIFTGCAETESDALRIAREACDAAVAAQKAGFAIPRRRPDGWGARGVRSGWVFDWAAATVAVWEHDRSFWEARPLLPLDAPRSR
ncbi:MULTISPECIES: hypothetical protein [Streptomyces]|uniref:Uncharacterized protein n=3 Tax=Streptomyces TaxID=1883 RepID=A0ABY4USX7_STRFL|nr:MULTISPECIES: hypothetical protein [Streptomyces]APS19068.1 hypothetical protein TK78_08935 [Streptomyces sp. Tue 6075]EFE77745.1 conserved hypothetical protein [Streptomyces filamentosus NRRL 15998]ESU50300.1 hypothetical protein P376_1729 [Streptomyces sp. HCCB10043]EWS94671.1 hypothetical protein SSIG_05334 [Streptomyces filamentosus NRRL 11379]KAA6200457.1 hypothetical protein F2B00_20180 [Streptomyces parvus]